MKLKDFLVFTIMKNLKVYKTLPNILTAFTILIASSLPIWHQALADEVSDAQNYAQGLSAVFEKVADTITPSVVSISAVKKPKKLSNLKKKFNDPAMDPFREFFGDDFMERFQGPEGGGGQGQQGLGTGVIVDPSGYILTNNHVVGEADELTVTLYDKRKFKAEVKGKDPKTDIAVIKIKADHLTAAKLGDSDSLKIGEWVVASGNPFGLSNSITSGIVSAKGRAISGGSQFEDFIQTDAAINPGNSGGPLLNLKGEVVGINTAIFSRSGGYMGIGFAIPISMAKSVMESLISKGKVIRGWLGVGIQNLSEELSSSFNYVGTDGALVGSVSKGSPAYKAGFEQGDIITKFGGMKVTDVNQLRNLVANTAPGQTLDVEVYRAGKAKSLSVKVDELTTQDQQEPEQEKSDSSVDLGIEMQSLTPELSQQLHSDKLHGVVVTNVAPGGIGESAGLQPRDIIMSINGKPIKSVKELLAEITPAALTKGVRLVVDSQGMEHFIFLKANE